MATTIKMHLQAKIWQELFVMLLQAKIWQELFWCIFKQKYGKNNSDTPSSKNMARTILMHLQAKIWQEPLLATVCHCLLERDAKDRLFRMIRYSFSFRDGLVGFSRNPRLIRVLRILRPLLATFRGWNSHVLFPLTFFPTAAFAVRKSADKNQRTADDDWLWRHVWRKTSTAKQVWLAKPEVRSSWRQLEDNW